MTSRAARRALVALLALVALVAVIAVPHLHDGRASDAQRHGAAIVAASQAPTGPPVARSGPDPRIDGRATARHAPIVPLLLALLATLVALVATSRRAGAQGSAMLGTAAVRAPRLGRAPPARVALTAR
jgi:hypothetical protein